MNEEEAKEIDKILQELNDKINILTERQEMINTFIMKNLSVFQFEELVKELNEFDEEFRESLK